MLFIFLTASRADYGKIKPVIKEFKKQKKKIKLIVTGMHLIKQYGYTLKHILKDFKKKDLIIFSNQNFNSTSQNVFVRTVKNLKQIKEINSNNFLILHGDRLETLAAASLATFANIKIVHIEGGEISGTVDEMIRHAVTKLAHIHLVVSKNAKKVLLNSGEKNNVYITGSPDIDFMKPRKRPSIKAVRKKYGIPKEDYIISFLHPVATETAAQTKRNCEEYFNFLVKASYHCKVIHFLPNNDLNSKIIFSELNKLTNNNIIIIPSMRFEYYLTLLEKSRLIVGNSSSGIMETPYFGIPSINVGSRQTNRLTSENTFQVNFNSNKIFKIFKNILENNLIFKKKNTIFGLGNSAKRIYKILNSKKIQTTSTQKNYSNLN